MKFTFVWVPPVTFAVRRVSSTRCKSLTGIKPGETDLDLKFSLETVNCLGCCALGPVMEIDGKTHGKMAPAQDRRRVKKL